MDAVRNPSMVLRLSGVMGPWLVLALFAPRLDGGVPAPPSAPPSAPRSEAPSSSPREDEEVIRELEFLEALEMLEGLDLLMDGE